MKQFSKEEIYKLENRMLDLEAVIDKIKQLPRFEIYGTETEGSVETEYCEDGSLVDADDLHDIISEIKQDK